MKRSCHPCKSNTSQYEKRAVIFRKEGTSIGHRPTSRQTSRKMAVIPKGKRLKKGGGRRRKRKTAAAMAVVLSMRQQLHVEGYQTRSGGASTTSKTKGMNLLKRGQRLREATAHNTPVHTPVFTPATRSSADQAFLEKCDSSSCGDGDETPTNPNKAQRKLSSAQPDRGQHKGLYDSLSRSEVSQVELQQSAPAPKEEEKQDGEEGTAEAGGGD
ncbi:unnamed protein product [Amoebophrya sp. A25]|nr:unnamed protein product [Amoebophrya sp. A25]|eukprot:GSA25T00004302001.1